MKKLVLIFIAVFICFSSFSQDGSSFKKPLKFKLEGTISDVDTELPIEGATVKLVGSDSTMEVDQTDSSGFYSFKLQQNVDYEIEVTVLGFYTGKGVETTYNLKESTKYIHDFKLQWIIMTDLFFPKFYYEHNQTDPIFVEEQPYSVYEMAYNAFSKDFSTTIFEVIGSKYSTENDSISLIRAKMMVNTLVEMGIDSNRLILKDLGVSSYQHTNTTFFVEVHKVYDPPPLKFTLQGTITDINDSLPIKNAVVRLIGTDSSDIETQTDSLGFYSFKLKPATSYTIIVSAEKYLTSKGQETTLNLDASTKFIHNFKIQSVHTPYCGPPSIIYPFNDFKNFYTNETDYPIDSIYYNTLIDNPTIVIELIGYRTNEEKHNISIKRTQYFTNHLVLMGIKKARIKSTDGGVLTDDLNPKSIRFRIISDDFHLK